MTENRFRTFLVAALFFAVLVVGNVHANELLEREFKVEGGGLLSITYPESWGKKPRREVYDTVTDLMFGPFGPTSKPVFLVRIQTVVGAAPLTTNELLGATKIEIDKFRQLAFETDIPINTVDGPHASGLYFSITDPASKRGKFDYLTMAVVASGRLQVKVYFLSSDGAPDFGADALRLLRSVKYLPPIPKT